MNTENERLRGLLTTLRVSLNLDDTEYGLSQQEKRKLAADIDAALSQQTETPPVQTEQQPSTTQQVLGLILEECRYWQGRDEARRGSFACLYAKAKEIADNAAPQQEQSGLVEALEPSDLKVDVWGIAIRDGFDLRCASAVRVKHIPTGISVERSTERSQFANKEAALAVLTKLVAALSAQGPKP